MAKVKRPDISIIICTHNEGLLLHHTLRSIKRSIGVAKKSNLSAEVIIVADTIDQETKNYLNTLNLKDIGFEYRVEYVSHKDVGLSRNHGISLANGEFVTIMDGDDLMSGNWLIKARQSLVSSKNATIVHPQYQFSFGAFTLLWKMGSSTSDYFSHAGSVEVNYFCSMMMTTRDVVKKTPYRYTNAKDLLGYEDWLWNCDTLQKGIEHIIAPRTMYAYRRKQQGSRLSSWADCLMPRTDYFGSVNSPRAITNSLQASPQKLKKKYLKRVLLKLLTTASRCLFILLSPFKPLHHRIAAYIPSLKNETLHFFRPPGMPDVERKEKVPDWLIDEIRALHEFDHRVFLSKTRARYMYFYEPKPSMFTQIYWDLAKQIGDDCTHLFLLPWLKKGGADLEVINYTKAILEINPLAKVVLIATENSESPWAKRLDKRVKFINLGKKMYVMSMSDQRRLLTTVCIQLKPKRIHLVNSPVGYNMFEMYAKILSKASKLYIQVFCLDRTPDGQTVHYFIEQLQDKVNYLTKIFTDNHNVIDEIVKLQALPRDKFACHYQPMESGSKKTKFNKLRDFSHQKPLRVLWAGRLDAQKRPDLLLRIADEALKQDLPVKFDVYGSPVLDGNDIVKKLKRSKAIDYKGSYDNGLNSLNLNEYDVFLINSQWEGLPNAVLEAITAGLVIVASDAGGLREIIVNKKTGYLVSPFDKVGSYIGALKDIIKDPSNLEKYRVNAQALVNERHTWQHFIEQVKKDKEYIET